MKTIAVASQKISRRRFLKGCAGMAALSLAACQIPMDEPGLGLGALARRRGRSYGVAVQSRHLSNLFYREALKQEAALLTPEGELKWKKVQPRQGVFDFSGYARLVAFAGANGMDVRGHTLVWHSANPAWLKRALTKKSAVKILGTHIQRVIRETSSVIREWDVVNEAVHPLSTREDGLRPSPWLKALGPDYIPLAFQLAHDANPDLTLVYNDYGTEYADGNGALRRKHMLRLLQKLKSDGVPVHALGLQSHLQAHRPLGGQAFLDFLSEIRAMGLSVKVTELDLDVSRLPGRMDDRVRAAQNYLRTYLDMVQESGEVSTLVTWGLSDRFSWLRRYVPNLKGMLPLDENFNRTATWNSLREKWAA